MGVLLPAEAFVKTFDSDELVKCGSVDLLDHIELTYLRVLLFVHGAPDPGEKLRAKVFSDSDYSALYATSEWALLSEIEDLSEMWWGWLRFSFDRQHLNKSQLYYLAIESDGYVRDGDTKYLSASLNWPLKQYEGDADTVMMQIYGHRRLD